jgi:hypothetical protein
MVRDWEGVDRAKSGVSKLTKAVETWRIEYGDYPDSLGSLATEGGKAKYAQPDDLVDPWGQPYRYDADGPRNQGHRPDIWAVLPDGETIGNWPAK